CADRLIAGCAAAYRILRAERLKAQHVRAPLRLELVYEVRQRAGVEIGRLDITVLLKAGQRGRVAPRDTQRAVGEYALGVVDMADHFFDAPLAGRWPDARGVIRYLCYERAQFVGLTAEHRE